MAVMLALGMPLTYDRKGMVKVIKPQAASSQGGMEEGFFSAMLADRNNKDDVCESPFLYSSFLLLFMSQKHIYSSFNHIKLAFKIFVTVNY